MNISDKNSVLAIKRGNVFILQHSFFKNVLQFGCSSQSPKFFADKLSDNSRMPGKFSVIGSLYCDEPCEVKERVIDSLKSAHYVENFYEISVEVAVKAIRREILRIPISTML